MGMIDCIMGKFLWPLLAGSEEWEEASCLGRDEGLSRGRADGGQGEGSKGP
jgi:hypothetical protein